MDSESDSQLQQIIKERLTRFTQLERNDIIQMLLLCGIKHYSLLYPGQNIQTDKIKIITEKYINDLTLDPLKLKENASKYNVYYPSHVDLQVSDRRRKYRPDSMARYPFADELGSVPDVLKGNCREKVKILEMGAPARKRLIEKVFGEMRLDNQGIRLSDLPEAFQRIGIEISNVLRRLLEKTRSNQLNGPISFDDDSTVENPEFYQYTEKHVTLIQWKTLVHYYLTLMKEGRDSRDIVHIFDVLNPNSRPSTGRRSNHLHNNIGENEDDYDDDDDNSLDQESEDRPESFSQESTSSNNDHRNNGDDPKVKIYYKKPKSKQTRERERQEKIKQMNKKNKDPISQQTHDYYKNLRRVQSRISDAINKDKHNFHQVKHKTDSAALNVLASHRIQQIHKVEIPQLLNPSSSDLYFNRRDSQKVTPKYGKDIELSSGQATLDIADAFLNSSVGKYLVQDSYPDSSEALKDFDQEINPQLRASELLGLKVPSSKKSISSNTQTAQIGFGHKSIQEKYKERKLDEESKYLYNSSGKTVRSGWVGDFGPNHTRPGYLGPEKHKISLNQNEPLFEESLSEKDFKRSFDTTTPRDYLRNLETNSSNKYKDMLPSKPMIDIPSSPESQYAKSTRSKYSNHDYHSQNVSAAQSEGSSSLDPAVAGAGANINTGLFYDADYNLDDDMASLQLDEDLLTRLHESVALKDAIKS